VIIVVVLLSLFVESSLQFIPILHIFVSIMLFGESTDSAHGFDAEPASMWITKRVLYSGFHAKYAEA
jgi:hypothetical protein